MRNAIMKSAMAIYEIRNHPRCGTATNHKHNLILISRPTIPKMLKSLLEIRLGSIKTRQLVYKKQYALTSQLRLQHLLQNLKCLCPIRRQRQLWVAKFTQSIAKIRQLSLGWCINRPRHLEGKFILE